MELNIIITSADVHNKKGNVLGHSETFYFAVSDVTQNQLQRLHVTHTKFFSDRK